MKVLLWCLLIGVFAMMQTSAAQFKGKRSEKIAELIKKRSEIKKKAKEIETNRSKAVDVIIAHRDKKEQGGRPRRALSEIGDELLDRKLGSSSFGAAKTTGFGLLNKRKGGRLIDHFNEWDVVKSNKAKDDDDLEVEAEAERIMRQEEGEESYPTKGAIKQKRPYRYSIAQSPEEIASWKKTKIYMVVIMFAFIIGVIAVSYYRNKNKMLLPGKLM